MNDLINRFNLKELSGRDSRLLKEWQELDTLCSKRKAESPNPRYPSISYIIRRKNVLGLPTEYEIWYRCKSIVGVKKTRVPREPIFGYLHKMTITLPNNYPAADGNPIFTFKTNIWHPNIRYFGAFAGRVCINMTDTYTDLLWGVNRVASYLRYDTYHATMEPPFPEDLKVAEWVIRQGEPHHWIMFEQ